MGRLHHIAQGASEGCRLFPLIQFSFISISQNQRSRGLDELYHPNNVQTKTLRTPPPPMYVYQYGGEYRSMCCDDSKHTEHMNTYNSIKGTNTEECNESLLHPDIWRWNDAAQIIITSRCTSLFCFFILLTLGNKYEESNPRIRIYSRLALLIV